MSNMDMDSIRINSAAKDDPSLIERAAPVSTSPGKPRQKKKADKRQMGLF